MTATALRVLGAYRAGARLGTRPGSPVVHITPASPLTPSGRYLPAHTRPVCGARTRRLGVVAGPVVATARGRRFCRRCTALLPTCLGRHAGPTVTRVDLVAAFGHLLVEDLDLAARWCQSVEDTHAVARIALEVYGPAPLVRPTRTTTPEGRARLARWELHQLILARRGRLREAEMPADARDRRDAAAAAVREQGRLAGALHRRDEATITALERERAGAYLTPRQQYLVDHAV